MSSIKGDSSVVAQVRKTGHFVLFIGVLASLMTFGCGSGNMSTVTNSMAPVAAFVSGTIAVGTSPVAIVVDSTANKIYVTDFGTTPTGKVGCAASGSDIEAIDGATQSVSSAGFWFNPMNPFALSVNPTNHRLYVLTHQYWSGWNDRGECGLFGQDLEMFDSTSLQQTSNHWGSGGSGLDVNPTTGTVYVASRDNIEVIDSSGNLPVIATIAVGSGPIGVAVNATANRIYAANGGSNDVSVIDGISNTVVATITDPQAVAPVAIAVNPTTNTVYVANSKSNNLTVIDGLKEAVIATIRVGTSPLGVAVDSETDFIYVANSGDGSISVINGATNATTTLRDAKAVNPTAVAVNSVTNKIYVVNSGSDNVSVIDGAH